MRRAWRARTSFKVQASAAVATAPNGRLTQNTVAQIQCATKNAPISGAMSAPITHTLDT